MQFRQRHWLWDVLTTRLDLIHTQLDLIWAHLRVWRRSLYLALSPVRIFVVTLRWATTMIINEDVHFVHRTLSLRSHTNKIFILCLCVRKIMNAAGMLVKRRASVQYWHRELQSRRPKQRSSSKIWTGAMQLNHPQDHGLITNIDFYVLQAQGEF